MERVKYKRKKKHFLNTHHHLENLEKSRNYKNKSETICFGIF